MLETSIKFAIDIFVFIFKALFYISIPTCIPIGFMMIINVLILYKKGIRKPQRDYDVEFKHVKMAKAQKHNLIVKLFWDLPKQWASDFMKRNPDHFKEHGIICYCGLQGKGKTISLIRDTMLLQNQYPKVKVLSNLGYQYEDKELKHWKDIMNFTNNEYGVICHLDEVQAWFSSLQSKDFPPEMLGVICQNRKQKRLFLMTSQIFTRMSKPIREQVSEVRECHTFLGCFTVVVKKEPVVNVSTGETDKLKFRGMYCFVHSKEIRDAYNTYKVIKNLNESGFKPESELLRDDNNTVIKLEQKKKGILRK